MEERDDEEDIYGELPVSDKECAIILLILTLRSKMRFNELHNELSKIGSGMQKSKLSTHLKHLTSKNIIIRKVEEAQNVSYTFNEEEFGNIKSIVKRNRKTLYKIAKGKEIFYSFSPNEQIGKLMFEYALTQLNRLRTNILFKTSEKEDREDTGLAYFISNAVAFEAFDEDFVVEKSIKDKNYREQILKEIDDAIKVLETRFLE